MRGAPIKPSYTHSRKMFKCSFGTSMKREKNGKTVLVPFFLWRASLFTAKTVLVTVIFGGCAKLLYIYCWMALNISIDSPHIMLHCVEEEKKRKTVQYLTDQIHKSAYVYSMHRLKLHIRSCIWVDLQRLWLNHQNRKSSALLVIYSESTKKRALHGFDESVEVRTHWVFCVRLVTMDFFFEWHFQWHVSSFGIIISLSFCLSSTAISRIVIPVRYPKYNRTHGIIIIYHMQRVCVPLS